MTEAAVRARCTAACPAEFPPPTTNTVAPAGGHVERGGAVVHTRRRATPAVTARPGVCQVTPVAITTARASIREPPSSSTTCPGRGRPQPGHGLREHEAGAEEPGLLEGAVREVAPREPVREAEVVADPGAGAGLSARKDGLDHRRLEPLRGGVDGRGEPGRPGADDDDVAAIRLGLGREPERGREPLVRGVDERRAAPEGEHRQVAPSRPSSARSARPSSEPGGRKPKGTPIREKISRRRWARASNSSPTILAASNCGGCDASQSARNSATGRYSQRSRGPQGTKT